MQHLHKTIAEISSISSHIDDLHVIKLMNQLNDLQKVKTIVISERNYNTLKSLGSFGQSFDDVITNVLQQIKEQED